LSHSADAPTLKSPGNRTPTAGQLVLTVVLLAIVIAAVYLPVVNQPFSPWDDPKHIAIIWQPGWERAWRIISDFRLEYLDVKYYSPFPFLSLMLDQAMIGQHIQPQAWISKMNNVAFHVINTALVFVLLVVVGVGRTPAILGALIFAVHPLQVGTVAWVVERKNLLASLFYLSSIVVFIRYSRSPRVLHVPTIMLLFVAGLLSKPAVVTAPIAMFTWCVLGPDSVVRSKGPYVLTAALAAVGIVFGAYAVSTEVSAPGVLPPLVYRPLLAAGTIWFYLSKFVYPVELVVLYPRWEVMGQTWPFLFLFFALIAVIALLVRFRDRIDRLIAWGITVYVVNVLPVSGLIAFGHMKHSYVADHFAYFPMIGLSVIVARSSELILDRLGTARTARMLFLASMCALICVLAVLSVRQIPMWSNPTTLWEATLKVNPNSWAALNNYGSLVAGRGELDKAQAAFEKAVKIAPNAPFAYVNLADIYRSKGDRDTARRMYERAVEIEPLEISAALRLADFLRESATYEQSVPIMRGLISRKPHSAALRIELAAMMFDAGHEEEALGELDEATHMDPLAVEPYIEKGRILLRKGAVDQSILLFQRALDVQESAGTRILLGTAYARKGRMGPALQEFLTAYRLRPRAPQPREYVANTLIDLGRFKEAEEFCQTADKIGSPCSPATLKRLGGRGKSEK
jgi:protein O-mannosyl-transferase